ncbi:MAG: PQQ-binding-like beta-propeller repeat protein [Pseudomonadota bacterium]
MTLRFVQLICTRLIAFLALALAVACSSNPVTNVADAVTGIFDGDDEEDEGAEEDEEEDEDEDEGVSILALDETIVADPRFAGVLIDLPPSYRNVSWPQPGGEADHTLHHLSADVSLEEAWKTDIGAHSGRRSRLTSPPVVADGKIYVIDTEARVSAIDLEDGERLWRTDLTPEVKERFRLREMLGGPDPAQIGFGGGVAFENGRIFVTSGFGFAAALNAETGEELWRTKTAAPVRTAPTAYRGSVYFVTNTNELISLSQESGEKNWNFQSFEEAARILSSASPAAAGDLVVAPFSSGELIAFLSDSGRSVWNDTLARNTQLTALSTLNDIAGAPVIDRGLVYVVSHAGRLAAIDIRTGQRVWEAPIASLQMPWVAGDYIFVVSVDAELVCVSRNDGAVVWVEQLRRYKKEKKRKGRISWAGPVMVGERLVLVSSEGEVVAVAPQTGAVLDTKKLGGGSSVSPIVADETIYILSEAGKLYALK